MTAKKKASPRRRPSRLAPMLQDAPPPELTQPLSFEEPATESRGRVLLMGLFSLAVLFFILRWAQRPVESPVAPPVAVAAPPALKPIAKPAPKPAQEQTLFFDRKQAKPLALRCWRAEGAEATLDVFNGRNQRVRSLRSAAGPAGWQGLDWDGKDEAGQPVPAGIYFLRPSTDALQQLREVKVHD